MADSEAFEWVCRELERETALDRLESRGTMRLALREAGLETRTVTSVQIAVVLRRLLPAELRARGIEDDVCESMAARVESMVSSEPTHEAPDDVFRRLGG